MSGFEQHKKEIEVEEVTEVKETARQTPSRKRMPEDVNLSAESAVASISMLLQREIEKNDPLGPQEGRLVRFNSLTIPNISIAAYVQRLAKHAHTSAGCLVAGLIYLQRVAHWQQIRLNSYNVHRLYFCAVVVATKFLDDVYFNNAFYARIGGVGLKEMNSMELDFLYMIGFRLYISPAEYDIVEIDVEREAARLGCEEFIHGKMCIDRKVCSPAKKSRVSEAVAQYADGPAYDNWTAAY
uniref:Cyclin n=1 Tax=Palpitomonas bilix TaxID=652834 RepID=A0A7S3G0J3_9EUKA|mmetsp:Transcript_15419/g.39001  ORF Transcript_15419/g.39001 Transcript_15419/m.39001 type:complete len:240 (+) Transcript_15419:426-1145(+)